VFFRSKTAVEGSEDFPLPAEGGLFTVY